jgi:hypothetical protein
MALMPFIRRVMAITGSSADKKCERRQLGPACACMRADPPLFPQANYDFVK